MALAKLVERGVGLEPIGMRLTIIRTRQRRESTEVAREAGITRAQLSRIEHSVHIPYERTLRRICEALGVDFDEVIEGTEVEEKYKT